MPPWMEDFFSNHIILFFLIVGYVIYRLFKLLGSGSQNGLKMVAMIIVVIAVIMALRNPSAVMPPKGDPSQGFWWAVGHFGGVGGGALTSLDRAGYGMMSHYDNCLFYYVTVRQRQARMRELCPGKNVTNQGTEFELCMETVLGENDPETVQFCRQTYRGPAGLTHELMLSFCTTFPKWCTAPADRAPR